VKGIMRTKVLAVIVGSVVAAAAVAGCSNPPAAAIESANAAMTAADSVEAGTYAAEAYKAAQDAQAELQAELAAQESKFGLFRSYDRATELATVAAAAAQQAETIATTERDRVRTETTQLVADARLALNEAMQMIETAPAGKGSQADLAAMKADLTAVESSLGEADSAIAASQFGEARSKAQAAMEAAGKVKSSVQQAVTMRAGARRPA
jgi:hypothetical protein